MPLSRPAEPISVFSRPAFLPPHRHLSAYLALCERGAYEESSIDGRFLIEPGHAVVHPMLHAHCNLLRKRRAAVRNLNVRSNSDYGVFVLGERPFELVRRTRSTSEAFAIVRSKGRRVPGLPWPRLVRELMARIRANPGGCVAEAARGIGLRHSDAAKLFRRTTGFSMVEFRNELRLQRVADLLSAGETPVVAAAESGYSDQSHLSREVKQATGMTARELTGFLNGQRKISSRPA